MTLPHLGYPRIYTPTGRYRFRLDGERVLLQLEERTPTGTRTAPDARWRDARPQDVLDLVSVKLTGATIPVRS